MPSQNLQGQSQIQDVEASVAIVPSEAHIIEERINTSSIASPAINFVDQQMQEPLDQSEGARRRSEKEEEKSDIVEGHRHRLISQDDHLFEPAEVDEVVVLLPDSVVDRAYQRRYSVGSRQMTLLANQHGFKGVAPTL